MEMHDIEIKFRDLPLKARLFLIATDLGFGLMMAICFFGLFGLI